MQPINNAVVEWRDEQPFASNFQDVYFSSDNGLLETEYVFLLGNDLSSRWQKTNNCLFTIAETGFGTGLNFLCASQLWLSTAPEHATLHFISVEKYPLSLNDLTRALDCWPELKELAEPLLANYENLLIDETPLSLYNNRVRLSLLIGDATMCLAKLATNPKNKNEAFIDAWFLDGFSPSKNSEMWRPELFVQMALLSNTATTLATFTSAATVRRDLITAGFKINKQTGFGKKREMLRGRFLGNANDA
ncbi:MAG: tRNA (5-methylaminomethyl-2-thiouridine)(34)-methyltransferase MnmD [Methylotenera sp.]|nr:tRNA (5-methylaminomethyl-2-thiouridine)(34)-methyltransferase MnmD [Methylotenera sp.]